MRAAGPSTMQRRATRLVLACAPLLLLAAPPAAGAQDGAAAGVVAPSELPAAIARRAEGDLGEFYEARRNLPLWLGRDGRPTPAADLLLERVEGASADGLKPRKLKASALRKARARVVAGGDAEEAAEFELAASRAYVAYVKALRGAKRADMAYESEALEPVVPTTQAALSALAGAPSAEGWITGMGWMHPLYAPLRDAAADPALGETMRERLRRNLERVRALPAMNAGRHVLVDAGSARLWLYEDGRAVDSMRVVVGRADQQTPMMAGFLRTTIANPYWNVPEDLVRTRIAPHVLSGGQAYLKAGGYQVLSDWSEAARPVNPALVDWRAVAAGAPPPRVRQLPGPRNFMGRAKFMFPNALGIYLHDTPDKGLMLGDARQLSSGCVRLEDAARFARWLMGKPLPRRSRTPEQRIELAEPVPVYITYLTALPEGGHVAFHPDVYARDGSAVEMARR